MPEYDLLDLLDIEGDTFVIHNQASETLFDMGIVEGVNTFLNDEDIADGLKGKPKGTYTVQLETRIQKIYNVLAVGMGMRSGQQMGSCYVVGTRVLICYLGVNRIPIIIGSLPFDYKNQYGTSGAVNLKEGESIMQASPPADSKSKIGGYVHVRKDGTVVMESTCSGINATVELGKKADDVDETGIRLRMSVGGASVALLNNGEYKIHTYSDISETCQSKIVRVAKDSRESVDGDKVEYIKKNYIVNTVSGAFFSISENGDIQLSDKSGKNVIAFDATNEALNIVGGDGNFISFKSKELDILANETLKLYSGKEITIQTKDFVVDSQSALVKGNKVALGDLSAVLGIARMTDATTHICPIIGVPVPGTIVGGSTKCVCS